MAYQAVVNPLEGHSKERRLDDHFSLYFGWPELAEALAEIYAALPAEQREGVRIFTSSGRPSAITSDSSWGPNVKKAVSAFCIFGFRVTWKASEHEDGVAAAYATRRSHSSTAALNAA